MLRTDLSLRTTLVVTALLGTAAPAWCGHTVGHPGHGRHHFHHAHPGSGYAFYGGYPGFGYGYYGVYPGYGYGWYPGYGYGYPPFYPGWYAPPVAAPPAPPAPPVAAPPAPPAPLVAAPPAPPPVAAPPRPPVAAQRAPQPPSPEPAPTPTPGPAVYAPAPPAGVQETPPPPLAADSRGHLRVSLPADAVLWFDGEATDQTGAEREFTTPELDPGKTYTYELKARWTLSGRPVEQCLQVEVRPDKTTTVSFGARPPTLD